MFYEIKEQLSQDSDSILVILEDLDCHDIDCRKYEIRCALPDSMNNTSVRIKLNPFLSVDIFSRHDFSNYEVSDIFSLVRYMRNCSFIDAVKHVCSLSSIEFKDDNLDYIKSKSIKEIKRFKPKKKKELSHTYLQESFLNKFSDEIVNEWVEEGINEETQKLFGVRVDKKNERWMIPIRDSFGNLLSVKGRTYVKDFQLKGIPKYIHSNKIAFNDVLFGYNITAKYVHEKDEIILVEAEKSVMKAYSFGEKNFGGVGKAGLNAHQIKAIVLSPYKRVVIAYDKDIGMEVIQKDIDALKHYKEVYYILDKNNILKEKEAPVDSGYDNWITLYQQRKRGK